MTAQKKSQQDQDQPKPVSGEPVPAAVPNDGSGDDAENLIQPVETE